LAVRAGGTAESPDLSDGEPSRLNAEETRQLAVLDGGGQGRQAELEVDGQDDVARAGPPVEQRPLDQARPVPEAEGLRRQIVRAPGQPVVDVHARDASGHVPPVGADVLDRRRADRAGDAGEGLQAHPFAFDRVDDESVPGRSGRHPEVRALAAPLLNEDDVLPGVPDDDSVEVVVGGENVRPPAEHHEGAALCVGGADGFDDLLLAGRLDELPESASRADRRELGECAGSGAAPVGGHGSRGEGGGGSFGDVAAHVASLPAPSGGGRGQRGDRARCRDEATKARGRRVSSSGFRER